MQVLCQKPTKGAGISQTAIMRSFSASLLFAYIKDRFSHDIYNLYYVVYLYRRLLQMGVYNAELFNNLGLCCFYAQQYDMTLTCFERALSLADEVTLSDVWYNIGHVALVS